ncbi:MAG: hypothetical protein FWH18_04895 [Marinilabiliaceae bacterium]|nr:hypothetical protein [Marinilabiliaceae bacterium]
MKHIILIVVLLLSLPKNFAQVDLSHSKHIRLPKRELAISVGDNMVISQKSEITIKELGSYTLSYLKRLDDDVTFWLGGYFNIITYATYYHYWTVISLAPSMRVSYLNKSKATLYSGLSLGFGLELIPPPYPSMKREYDPFIFYQVTALGFSYGKKFFAGAELGYGHKGIGCFNAGYKW